MTEAAVSTPHGTGAGDPDIEHVFDVRPYSFTQLRVIILCSIIAMFDGYDLQCMALAVPAISSEWGVSPSLFGPALSAVVIGIAIGSALFGPLGDRWGRKPVLIAGMLIIGIGSLGSAASGSFTAFFVWRVCTGIGFGACIPNMNAMIADYVPFGRRALFMALISCMLSLGAFLSGQIAPSIIAGWGWHGLFLIGGIAPLLLAAILVFALPESIKFLAFSGRRDAELLRLSGRLSLGLTPAGLARLRARLPARKPGLGQLISPNMLKRTLLTWLIWTSFCFAFYGLNSWLPTLLREAGMGADAALRSAVMVWFGGLLGGPLAAWLFDRYTRAGPAVMMLILTMLLLATFRMVPMDETSWSVMLFCVGVGLIGLQATMTALVAHVYPLQLMATGMGWASSIGRLGAILGPLAGGWALAAGFGTADLLLAVAVPVAIAAISIIALFRATDRPAAQPAAPAHAHPAIS